jgi:hypothetical protein
MATFHWPKNRRTTDSIQVFGKSLSPGSGVHAGDFDTFLEGLGVWIDAPVVAEMAERPKQTIRFSFHQQMPRTDTSHREDQDPKLVLPNIAAQTNLTFTKEKRPMKILFVERKSKPEPDLTSPPTTN